MTQKYEDTKQGQQGLNKPTGVAGQQDQGIKGQQNRDQLRDQDKMKGQQQQGTGFQKQAADNASYGGNSWQKDQVKGQAGIKGQDQVGNRDQNLRDENLRKDADIRNKDMDDKRI